MKITITGRHLDLSDSVHSYAEKKLQKIETFFNRIIEAQMVLSAEKHRRIAEVTLHAKGVQIHAQQETEDIYASIDGVIEKIETQTKKYKEKLRNRKHISRDEIQIIEGVLETSDDSDDEDDEEENLEKSDTPRIVRVSKFAPKPMTIEEAVLQIMVTEDIFLMFSNSLTNQVNVVYKRKDGSFGLIEPELE